MTDKLTDTVLPGTPEPPEGWRKRIDALVIELEAALSAAGYNDPDSVPGHDHTVWEALANHEAWQAMIENRDNGGPMASVERCDQRARARKEHRNSARQAADAPLPADRPRPPLDPATSLSVGGLCDLLVAFAAGETSEHLLRSALYNHMGFTADQTRALWVGAVARGKDFIAKYEDWRHSQLLPEAQNLPE